MLWFYIVIYIWMMKIIISSWSWSSCWSSSSFINRHWISWVHWLCSDLMVLVMGFIIQQRWMIIIILINNNKTTIFLCVDKWKQMKWSEMKWMNEWMNNWTWRLQTQPELHFNHNMRRILSKTNLFHIKFKKRKITITITINKIKNN